MPLRCTAHGMDVTNYWTPTAMLLLRPDDALTADERASVETYLAFIDEMDGIGRSTPLGRWCAAAWRIERPARALGRIAGPGEGATQKELDWIKEQRCKELNSFQRARLVAIPGWTW